MIDKLAQFEAKHAKVLNSLFWLILALGIGLRCYQYLMGRSLWEDEAHMALNMMSRNYLQLLQPLDYVQAAPVLFLLTTKTFALLFGYGPLGLRLLPFLASIITFPLFYPILHSFTKSKIASLLGFFACSVNIALIYFSSELKTYGMDVAVYLALLYLIVSPGKFLLKNRPLWLMLVGSAGLLYANTTFLFLFCAGIYFLLGWISERKIDRSECWILIVWAAVFTVNYFLFIFHHPHMAAQQEGYAFAFPPLPFSGSAFHTFMQDAVNDICFSLLLYVSASFRFGYVLLAIFLIAIGYVIYKKQYKLLLFTCLPILIHFALAVFKIYPFWYRFLLYFIPGLLVLMSLGAMVIVKAIVQKLHLAAGLLLVPVLGYFFTMESFRQFPLWFREIKPSLNYINKHYPGRYVYVTTPYTLYKYYVQQGIAKDTLYEGIKWMLKPEQYYQEVAATRTGYLLLHATDPTVDGYDEVLTDLKRRGLIVKEFSYKSYTVSELKPLGSNGGSSSDNDSLQDLNYTYFAQDKTFDFDGKKVAAIWSGDIISKPFFLAKGTYEMEVVAKGTPVGNIYPQLKVSVNDKSLGELEVGKEYGNQRFDYVQVKDGYISIRILLANDAVNESLNEDRNAFLQRISFHRKDIQR